MRTERWMRLRNLGFWTTSLTAREIEVLYCISHGQSNKEAAQHLSISPSTVRAHLENVFRKLACSTRAAATVKAMRLGLLEARRF